MNETAEKPLVTEENAVLWEFSESESWSIHEDEVTGKPVAYKKVAVKSAASSIFFLKKELSSAVVSHMGKVFSIV